MSVCLSLPSFFVIFLACFSLVQFNRFFSQIGLEAFNGLLDIKKSIKGRRGGGEGGRRRRRRGEGGEMKKKRRRRKR